MKICETTGNLIRTKKKRCVTTSFEKLSNIIKTQKRLGNTIKVIPDPYETNYDKEYELQMYIINPGNGVISHLFLKKLTPDIANAIYKSANVIGDKSEW